ncbi:GTP-binding protein EngB required for normal cell division [Methanococcus voltae PS]|nr:GTP-binding protein EngB required for normal cell division [Methanococcus voltae PS]
MSSNGKSGNRSNKNNTSGNKNNNRNNSNGTSKSSKKMGKKLQTMKLTKSDKVIISSEKTDNKYKAKNNPKTKTKSLNHKEEKNLDRIIDKNLNIDINIDDVQKFKKIIKTKKEDTKPKVIVMGRSNVGKSTFVKSMTADKTIRVGKKPGVTLKIAEYDMGNYYLVDLPGFGYMEGIDQKGQEEIKDNIIRYVEDNQRTIATAIQILDAKSFVEIVQRWEETRELPIDLEMADFLEELDLKPIYVINKMDKIKNSQWDEELDVISEKLGFLPPWRQWIDILAPAILKEGLGLEEIGERIKNNVKQYYDDLREQAKNKDKENLE